MRSIALLSLALASLVACGHTASTDATRSPRSAGSFACDDAQFAADQSAFAGGALGGDQFVDVCGTVTRVLAARETRSGDHGYFYVSMPSGYEIEIVSNLDAMAEASADRPPGAWPWVAAGDYVYVQGRYYFDRPSRQGIDWTEDDTSRSWPHVGYVAVCNAAHANCIEYR